jgi:hypothetical protein
MKINDEFIKEIPLSMFPVGLSHELKFIYMEMHIKIYRLKRNDSNQPRHENPPSLALLQCLTKTRKNKTGQTQFQNMLLVLVLPQGSTTLTTVFITQTDYGKLRVLLI